MKCGCARKDSVACLNDQVEHGLVALSTTMPEWCDCVCHDEHKRKAKRLKLKPEEKRNPSS